MRSTHFAVIDRLVRTAHDQPRLAVGGSGIAVVILLQLILLLVRQDGS
jgi:hypothetical protein